MRSFSNSHVSEGLAEEVNVEPGATATVYPGGCSNGAPSGWRYGKDPMNLDQVD